MAASSAMVGAVEVMEAVMLLWWWLESRDAPLFHPPWRTASASLGWWTFVVESVVAVLMQSSRTAEEWRHVPERAHSPPAVLASGLNSSVTAPCTPYRR